MSENSTGFSKFEKIMQPLVKLSQFRVVRAIMAAGMATIPFTIVGSMLLVINILPQTFPGLEGFFNATFFRISDLYMLGNVATMGTLALYFGIVIGYELTKIEAAETGVNVDPLNGALLSMFAFLMCIPELVKTDGKMILVNIFGDDGKVVDGFRVSGGISRFGSAGIFTAILMAVLAVKLYCLCVRKKWVIKMPEAVPPGVSKSFTALIPTVVVAFVVILINGILVALGTDIYDIISIPFSFVTGLTNTWLGLMVILFLIQALWIVGIHGATIITSFLTAIVLTNMQANAAGAHIPYAGEFLNCYVTIGGSGATLGLTIFMALLAKSEQLKVLGRASIVPGIFNINEPIIFGLPLVYNPFTAIPFFLAPMASGTLAYFAIKLEFVKPMVAQVPWPSPVGLGAFIGTAGDWKAAVLGILCAALAFIIYFPFIKNYDGRLVKEEKERAATLAAEGAK